MGIENDDIPENDENIRIELRNPTGGSEIDENEDFVNVIIMANDYVAGVLSFTNTAYLVTEGVNFFNSCISELINTIN